MKSAYSFTVLRYVHDVTTGEFVNVGVALCAPKAKFVGARCRTTYDRISGVFPGVNGPAFKRLMKKVQSRFQEEGNRLQELPFEGVPQSVMTVAHSIVCADDSSLQWAPAGGGLTADPAKTLEQLYRRMVATYDDRDGIASRSDDDVWSSYKKTLESTQVLQYLQEKKIVIKDDEVTFSHAFKNGVWHCLEPLSFDLASAKSIREKAHKMLGRIVSIQESAEEFKLYLLLGAPKRGDLQEDFVKAMGILNKLPVEKELVQEKEAAQFGHRLEKQVMKHLHMADRAQAALQMAGDDDCVLSPSASRADLQLLNGPEA
jgi:hypothetical protein